MVGFHPIVSLRFSGKTFDMKATLSSLYCDKFKCPPTDFEKKVLWRCMHPLAVPLASGMWLVHRRHFQTDLTLIEGVKQATTYREVKDQISFACTPHRPLNYLRIIFNIRMSKRRLQRLARELFSARIA